MSETEVCKFVSEGGRLGGLWKIEKKVGNERLLELLLRFTNWIPCDILQGLLIKL